MTPFGYLIDDSLTYSPWFSTDATAAEAKRAAGKRVIDLFVNPDDAAQPSAHAREASAAAERIMRNAEAMEAIRRLRELSGAGVGASLSGVVHAIEWKLQQGIKHEIH
jgi:hypothetical protein